ncbi:MAG TPA: hypothetical protein VGJ02_03575 [Pyrinomonadaceae bacterium]|jgi:hypothetical protein
MLRNRTSLIYSLILSLAFAAAAFSQAPDAMKPSVATGDVTSLDSAKIVLQTKDGSLNISLSDKTEFKRVPADNPSLKAAVAATFSDISVGDKLVVSGIYGSDKSTLPARTVYIMAKSDIAQKQAKDSEEWRTRGLAGKVTAVDQLAGKITVEQRGLVGSTSVVVTPKDGIKYLRYAPDSVKFSEARSSSIADIKPGDMVRVLGDKGADGTTFAAEEIVSGAFQTRAGKVKSVDVANNQIVVTDMQTNKDLTIAVISSSELKKFPEEMANRMAQFQGGGAGGFRPAGGGQGTPAGGGQTQGGGQGRPGFGGGARGGGIDDMLERFPTITPADLKVGDVIAVSSTKNSDLDRITAIKLLSGVEPFLRAAQMSAARQGGSQRQLDLNIPGLDSFGTP